jgi:hypothetical protein
LVSLATNSLTHLRRSSANCPAFGRVKARKSEVNKKENRNRKVKEKEKTLNKKRVHSAELKWIPDAGH